MNNLFRVSWGGALTDYFTALNGVKQGAVLSPILCCVYADPLLILPKAGVGCFIGLHFAGALAYADDLVLLASTASAMRKLLAIGYVKIMPANIASNSMHLNPNVWLPNLRIFATLSHNSMMVFLHRR